MTDSAPSLEFINLEPTAADMMAQVARGLSNSQKTMPSAFFYDEPGSGLFDEICQIGRASCRERE